jgi:beta-galactosidase
MRTMQSLEGGWQFARADVGREAALSGDGQWDEVTLPHTWNAQDGFSGGNDYHRGRCWYRRTIDFGPASPGRRAFVEFAAAGMVAEVRVDDVEVGSHRGGYSIFRCDVTEALGDDGRGLLTVRVDNSPLDDVYPLLGDHTFFGGLYRGVRLITTPAVHVDLLDHGSPGVFVVQQSLDDDLGVLEAKVRVAHDGDGTATPTVEARVLDGDDTMATDEASVAVASGEVGEVTLSLGVDRPRRWDGRDDPHLYRVVVTIDGGADEVTLPFGLRTFDVDPMTGPHLNGRPYRLHGVSRHHDLQGKGPALSPEDHEQDLALFDELGISAVRLAHYQHDQYFYDLCDRAGIAVWAEIPFNAQAAVDDPETNAVEQMTDLVRQCAHHPSIICWGLQNEITLGEARRDPRPVVTRLREVVGQLDPGRPTAQANLGQVTVDDPIIAMADLNAMNLYHGWYYGEATDIGPALDEHHEANPTVPVGLSEYGADAYEGFHSAEPVPGDYTEEYQCVLHEEYWRAVAARPWVWASFVWNMFDFASDLRAEGGRAGRNMKGLVTYDRQVRKDAFHWYRANWSTEPFVHICSKRFANRHDARTTIKAYSNLDEVRLEVNGRDIGPGEGPDHVFEWEIDLAESVTEVRATADGDDGAVSDSAAFRKVDEPDPSYVCDEPARFGAGRGGAAARESWYEREGLAADPSLYSTWTPLAELLENPDTRSVLVRIMGPEMLNDPRLELAGAFTLDFLAGFIPDQLTDDVLREAHERLSVIPKP